MGELRIKINRTAHYGLISAAYTAQNAETDRVTSSKISKEHNIPLDYLIKLLQRMVKANILRSKRGPKGGFTLARPAKEITLLEIIEASGGPISSQFALAELAGNAEFSIEMEKVFIKASEKAASILSRAKLSQMVG